jgi:hypothetical protein
MAGQKPIDKWLGIGSIVVTILLFLFGKTPALVTVLCVAIFGLLIHPVWNFWWIEKSRWRQIFFIALLAVACGLIAYGAWPVNGTGGSQVAEPKPSLSLGEWLLPITTYVQSLPWAWIAIGVAVGFGLAALLLRVLRQRQTAREARVKQDRITELEDEKAALVRSKEEAQREIDRLKHDEVGLSLSLNSRIHELENYKWLHEMAERDKKEIDKYVVVREPSIDYQEMKGANPYFIVSFKVFNYSVHGISIFLEEDTRAIYRNDKELSGYLKSDRRVVNLRRGHGHMVLALKQWVSVPETTLINNPLIYADEPIVLNFDEVILTIKGADESLGIEPKRLKLSPIPIGETNPPNLRVEELKDRIKELEGQVANLTDRLREEENNNQNTYLLLSTVKGDLGKLNAQYGWLHEMAETQAKDIGRYVVVERVRFCYHEFIAPIPYLIFAVYIRNKSVFDITIEDEVNGHITIAGERLLGEKELIHNPKISPSGEVSLTMKQRLNPTEVNLVAVCENEPLGAFYYFENLEIMIAARTESPRFDRAPLKLPEHISSKDDEVAQLKSELASLHRRSETIIKLSLALGGAYTLEQMFEAGETPSRDRIEHWFNSTLRGHIHPDTLEALREGLPELTDSPDEQKELITKYCFRLRRFIANVGKGKDYSDQKEGSTLTRKWTE